MFLNMFSSRFSWIKFYLATTGLYPFYSVPFRALLYTTNVTINILMLWQIFILWHSMNFLTGFFYLSTPTVCIIACCIVYTYLHTQQTNIKRLCEHLRIYWGNIQNNLQNVQSLYMIRNKDKFLVCMLLYYTWIYVPITYQLARPFKDKIKQSLSNSSEQVRLVFPVTLLRTRTEYDLYLTLIFQTIFVYSASSMAVGYETLISILLDYNSNLFVFLRRKLENVKDMTYNSRVCKMVIDEYELNIEPTSLLQCIKLHQHYLNYFELIQDIFRPVWFNRVIVSSFLLAMYCYQSILFMSDPVKIVRYLASAGRVLFGIAFIVKYSEQLIKHSSLQDAVYSTLWYAHDKCVRKVVHMMQGRAKKPCVISIYGICNISAEMLSNIVSLGVSYFTFMSSIV